MQCVNCGLRYRRTYEENGYTSIACQQTSWINTGASYKETSGEEKMVIVTYCGPQCKQVFDNLKNFIKFMEFFKKVCYEL
jgi:hypothetical protein